MKPSLQHDENLHIFIKQNLDSGEKIDASWNLMNSNACTDIFPFNLNLPKEVYNPWLCEGLLSCIKPKEMQHFLPIIIHEERQGSLMNCNWLLQTLYSQDVIFQELQLQVFWNKLLHS